MRLASRLPLVLLTAFALCLPAARPAAAQVVINEIDYDQVGTDAAEFVELKNVGGGVVNLDNYALDLVNGTGGGAALYNGSPIDLPNFNLAAGDYYVICGNAATVPNCDLDITPDTDLVQNGAPDAVGLRLSGVLVDAVSYEGNTGAPYTETTGAPVAAADSNTVAFLGLSRFPDGADSNNNSADVSLRCITPGTINTSAATGCTAPPVLPNLTIDDVSLNEGNLGTTTFTFTVSLSAPAGPSGVTFDIATQDDTATTADNDYVTNSLTGQTIPSGSSTYTFDVTVNGDTAVESNETFFVNVTNVTGATVVDGQGVGTIQNDDSPNLTIDDIAGPEADFGTTGFIFTVSLDLPAGAGGVTFDIATQDNTATTADNDYVGNSLTGQTIPAGQQTYTFEVTINSDTTVEPDQTFFVNVTNVTGATVTDGQGLGTIQNDDFTPIHDIQGPGASSPIVGSSVTTRGVVTGVKSNGFFIQEPDASVDADPATSEGILVFGAPPVAAAAGNYVQVTGTVAEFVPTADPFQPPLTELTGATVTLLSSGNPLPAAIPLTPTFPDPAGVHDQLERLEGMRVSVSSLTVSGPTLGNVNEANATATSSGVFYGVVTGVPRPFREAGIPAPDPAPSGGGTIPPIPRFDSNPERIRVDSDGLVGGALLDVGAGAVVTGLVGPLDYSFRTYTILPDPGAPAPGVAGGPTATAVTPANGKEFTVASSNMQRFFDNVNDPSIGEPVLTAVAYDRRLAKASLAIRNSLGMPDIIGIAEMEDLATLQDLAARISADAIAASQPDPEYDAYLVEGNDVGGIDVAFLVKTAPVAPGPTPRVEVVEVQQELDGTLLVNPDSSTSVLNDRPPLRLNAIIHHANGASFPVTVIANHLRSLNDANSEEAPGSNGWPTDGARVRAKRQEQAEDLANLVQARQVADPAEHIILLGDFNAFEVNDGLGHSMGVIAGTPAPDNETAVPGDGTDLVNPDLDNLFDVPPPAGRYSYVFDGNAQNLDHILINAPLDTDTLIHRIEHARVNADFPETARNDGTTPVRLSDHDPVVAYFQVPAFSDPGSYFTVAPCRAVDTRAGAPLQNGVPQTFALHGVCGIPATATTLVLNLTVVNPTGSGELTTYAADAPPPAFSTLPFLAGRTRALIAVAAVSQDAAGEIAVQASVAGGGTVHVVLDVMGYFE